jgi:hypothetical protein
VKFEELEENMQDMFGDDDASSSSISMMTYNN